MKKFLALVMVLVLTFSLAACGNKEPDVTEPYHVKLQMSTLMIVPALEATKVVQDSLNKYLKETLGITAWDVELEIVSIADYFTTVPMELAGNEGADVIQVFDMASFVDQGYIIDMNPYLGKELKPTVDKIGNIIGSGQLATGTYMIPRYYGTVLDWKFIYDKGMTDAAGVDCSKVTSLDDLGDTLAELKAAYPDEHFLVYCDQFNMIYSYYDHTSTVGTYAATLGEDTTLVNYYETEAYKKAIYKAYEFRQKGYCDPEGSANTMSHDQVVATGSAKGVIMGHSAPCESTIEQFNGMCQYGATYGAQTICISDLYTDNLGIGITYCCKHPEFAAEFINLLYCDEFVWDTIIYGAEGQDYVWNADHTAVNYPDGLDANTIPYNCMYSCGMIGNGFQGLPFENNNDGNVFEYGQELMSKAWCPPLYGFTPVTAAVMNEYAAVNNVVEQYNKVLTYGDVNPDEVYPEFLSALKDAGIDNIIAEYQKQANEWLAAKG